MVQLEYETTHLGSHFGFDRARGGRTGRHPMSVWWKHQIIAMHLYQGEKVHVGSTGLIVPEKRSAFVGETTSGAALLTLRECKAASGERLFPVSTCKTGLAGCITEGLIITVPRLGFPPLSLAFVKASQNPA